MEAGEDELRWNRNGTGRTWSDIGLEGDIHEVAGPELLLRQSIR